jgi:mannitol/fructose-specific phosphotransferase system IIA component (Ntr-type)
MPRFEVSPSVAGTLSLADYTSSRLVVPEVRERDAAGIIGELSQVLQREGCIPDMLPFYHSALNQELLANTALQCGIAFPHARLGGIKQVQFALGRTPEPIPWGPRSSWPVQLIFLLAVPATDAARYLHLLANLARLGQEAGLLEELRSAPTAEIILSVLERVSVGCG